VAGGSAGEAGAFILNEGTSAEVKLRGKQTNIRIGVGDRLTTYMSGAGGYGDPFTRPARMVADDCRDGVVSIERARRDYAVVVDPANHDVDTAATAGLRARPSTDRP
jgi:N-methylhydantoinase B